MPPTEILPRLTSQNLAASRDTVVLPPPDGPTNATFCPLGIVREISFMTSFSPVLVIAHRMRTVAGADKIVALSDGTVAEAGAPETLLEQNGLYARMVKLQTESQNWKLA